MCVCVCVCVCACVCVCVCVRTRVCVCSLALPFHFIYLYIAKNVNVSVCKPSVCVCSSVYDEFSEAFGHFVSTNSRMSRHSHICSDMIILISDQILCLLLLAIMYAVVSQYTYENSGIFILFLVVI